MGWPTWRTVIVSSTNEDNSADIIVPTDRQYKIYNVRVEYQLASTVGTRVMALEILDPSSNEMFEHRTTVQPGSSAVVMAYEYGAAHSELVSARDTDFVSIIFPSFELPENWIIRIRDHNGSTNSTADAMTYRALLGISGDVF